MSTIEASNPSDPSTGPAVVHFDGDKHDLKMKVNLRDGKGDGEALIVRSDETPYMRLFYLNGIPEGMVEKMDQYGNVVMRGQLRNGKPFGLFTEYDGNGKVTWAGTYKKDKRYSELQKLDKMNGFFEETLEGTVLSVSEYNAQMEKNGRCYEFEGGSMKWLCLYRNGERERVLLEFNGKTMTEFDESGRVVYEGEYSGDITTGFARKVVEKQPDEASVQIDMGGNEKMVVVNREKDRNGMILSMYDYNDANRRNGSCYELRDGTVKQVCVYKNRMLERVLLEISGKTMIEYNSNGEKVYEGEYGVTPLGYVREGEGKEFDRDGKTVVYIGGWINGKRDGFGTEFKDSAVVFRGEWRKGKRLGEHSKQYVDRKRKWMRWLRIPAIVLGLALCLFLLYHLLFFLFMSMGSYNRVVFSSCEQYRHFPVWRQKRVKEVVFENGCCYSVSKLRMKSSSIEQVTK